MYNAIINMYILLISNIKYIQNDDADEYTVAEEESDIGEDNDEMFDSDIEDGDDVSDYVCSDGEEQEKEEMEDIEVFQKTVFILYDLVI